MAENLHCCHVSADRRSKRGRHGKKGVVGPPTDQQRHEDLVQVDHLDAAHTQLHPPVAPGRIGIGAALGSTRRQTQDQAENLLPHDGDHLEHKHER